jgi:hypothetical protein
VEQLHARWRKRDARDGTGESLLRTGNPRRALSSVPLLPGSWFNQSTKNLTVQGSVALGLASTPQAGELAEAPLQQAMTLPAVLSSTKRAQGLSAPGL